MVFPDTSPILNYDRAPLERRSPVNPEVESALPPSRLEGAADLPEELVRIADVLFRALPTMYRPPWPARFLAAARPDADLSLVYPAYFAWLLGRELPAHCRGGGNSPAGRLCRAAAGFHARAAAGDKDVWLGANGMSEWRDELTLDNPSDEMRAADAARDSVQLYDPRHGRTALIGNASSATRGAIAVVGGKLGAILRMSDKLVELMAAA